MRVLYAVGKKCNMLGRLLGIDPVPASADAVLGDVTALFDMASVRPFLFLAGSASNYIDFYMTQVVNGTFETAFSGGVPGEGWNAGDATISRDTSIKIDTGSLKIGGGTGKWCWYDVKVPSGKAMCCSVFAYQYGRARCRNLDTGKWLEKDGTWKADDGTVADLIVSWHTGPSVAGGWVNGYSGVIPFTVEDYVTCRRKDEVTLRFYFESTVTAGSFVYFDNFALWPQINFASLHHYDTPNSSIDLYGITGGGLEVLLGTFPASYPTTFLEFPLATYQRYKLLCWGEHPAADSFALGKMFMGEVQEIDHSSVATIAADETGRILSEFQDRTGSPFGPGQAYLQTDVQRRNKTLTLLTNSAASRETVRQILERSKNGGHVSLFVTDPDGDDTSAMLCSIESPDMEVTYNEPGVETVTLPLAEYPFPRIVG